MVLLQGRGTGGAALELEMERVGDRGRSTQGAQRQFNPTKHQNEVVGGKSQRGGEMLGVTLSLTAWRQKKKPTKNRHFPFTPEARLGEKKVKK